MGKCLIASQISIEMASLPPAMQGCESTKSIPYVGCSLGSSLHDDNSTFLTLYNGHRKQCEIAWQLQLPNKSSRPHAQSCSICHRIWQPKEKTAPKPPTLHRTSLFNLMITIWSATGTALGSLMQTSIHGRLSKSSSELYLHMYNF